MTQPPSAAQASVDGSAAPILPLKGVIAVVIGNWLEFYDFLVYTFFAVMMIVCRPLALAACQCKVSTFRGGQLE